MHWCALAVKFSYAVTVHGMTLFYAVMPPLRHSSKLLCVRTRVYYELCSISFVLDLKAVMDYLYTFLNNFVFVIVFDIKKNTYSRRFCSILHKCRPFSQTPGAMTQSEYSNS